MYNTSKVHSNDNKFVTTHYMLIKVSDLWRIPTYIFLTLSSVILITVHCVISAFQNATLIDCVISYAVHSSRPIYIFTILTPSHTRNSCFIIIQKLHSHRATTNFSIIKHFTNINTANFQFYCRI